MGVQSSAVSSKMHQRAYLIPRVTMSIFSALTGGGLRSPQKIRLNGKTLSDILAAHALFVRGKDGGTRAELAGVDLSRADLHKANRAYADLQGANLEDANLREAKLASADLSKSNLRSADLRKADLTERNLGGGDLTGAQAGGAEFFRAGVRQAILRGGGNVAGNFRGGAISQT